MPTNLQIDIKSESVTKLIDCVSKGIGAVFEPTRIVRKAKADAEAALISAQGEIARLELITRASDRLARVESRRQENIESIAKKAIKELPESVNQNPVSEDWIAQFFENCQDVSEQQMQKIWARILAGEVAQPGSFSRRTLQVLKTFDARDALAFVTYSSACFTEVPGLHFSFDCLATGNANRGMVRAHKPELVSIGLLEANERNYEQSTVLGWTLKYFGTAYKIVSAPGLSRNRRDHVVRLQFHSRVGEQLSRIISAVEIPDFVESLSNDLTQMGIALHLIRDQKK